MKLDRNEEEYNATGTLNVNERYNGYGGGGGNSS